MDNVTRLSLVLWLLRSVYLLALNT
jgi:hypothetical protein